MLMSRWASRTGWVPGVFDARRGAARADASDGCRTRKTARLAAAAAR